MWCRGRDLSRPWELSDETDDSHGRRKRGPYILPNSIIRLI